LPVIVTTVAGYLVAAAGAVAAVSSLTVDFGALAKEEARSQLPLK